MYVAVLNTQKSVLQEDAEKLRKELHEGTYKSCVLLASVSEKTSKSRVGVSGAHFTLGSWLNVLLRSWSREGSRACKLLSEQLPAA